MKLSIKAGSTSQKAYIFILDSSSTSGAGLANLAYNTPGLSCYRIRNLTSPSSGDVATLVPLVTQTVAGAWSSNGFVAIDNTNIPGLYRFDIPDMGLAVGARSVVYYFKGATNMVPLVMEIELTGWDNQDGVRGGMTALPNAVASAANGLLTCGVGTGQVNPASGKVPATLSSADVTGNVTADVQTVKTQAVTCSAGVTVNPYVGTATAAPAVSGAGKVTATLAAGDVTGYLPANIYQILGNAVTLDTTTNNDLADAILARGTGTVEASMDVHSLGTLIHGLTKWDIEVVDGTNYLVIKRVADSSTICSLPLTHAPNLDNITGVG